MGPFGSARRWISPITARRNPRPKHSASDQLSLGAKTNGQVRPRRSLSSNSCDVHARRGAQYPNRRPALLAAIGAPVVGVVAGAPIRVTDLAPLNLARQHPGQAVARSVRHAVSRGQFAVRLGVCRQGRSRKGSEQRRGHKKLVHRRLFDFLCSSRTGIAFGRSGHRDHSRLRLSRSCHA